MKKFLVLLVILGLTFTCKLQAQENDVALRIKEQLSPQGKKKIAKAEKYISAYNSDKSEAEKLEGKSKRKALRKQISASINLGKANKKTYKIYRDDLKKFTEINQLDSAKTINKKLARAKKIMRRSNSKRENALKLSNDENQYSVLKHADELEEKAFKDLYYAYALILNTGEQKQKSKENIAEKNGEIAVESPENNESVLNETIIDEPGISNTEINPENNTNTELGNNGSGSQSISEADNNVEQDDKNIVTYFKIQVAASKNQLSSEQLTKSFPVKDVLNVEIEGDWYKYSIRKKFTDYNEAIKYKDNLKMKGVFILAFKDGKKVSIEEALSNKPTEKIQKTETDNPVNKNIKTEPTSITVFRLQIGFSTKQLSATEIAQFKNGGMHVYSTDCGSWFIYTVGDFQTEFEAQNFKKVKGLMDADLVKFINGKLIEE